MLSILCTAKALELTEQDSPAHNHSSPLSTSPPGSSSSLPPAQRSTPPVVTVHPMVEELGRRKAAFFLNLLRSPIMNRLVCAAYDVSRFVLFSYFKYDTTAPTLVIVINIVIGCLLLLSATTVCCSLPLLPSARVTLPLLTSVVGFLKHLPLIGSLPPKLLDILDYFSSTYFYTSNSS